MGQYSSFKEALSDLIAKKGKSNAEIGRLLGGISGQRIGQYLLGGRNPKPDFFKKWKKAFGEDLESLIESNDSEDEIIQGTIKVTLQQHYDLLTKHATIMARLVERHLLADTNLNDDQKTSEHVSSDLDESTFEEDESLDTSDDISKSQDRQNEQDNNHVKGKLGKGKDKH